MRWKLFEGQSAEVRGKWASKPPFSYNFWRETRTKRIQNHSKPAEVDEVVQMRFPPWLVFSSVHLISKFFASTLKYQCLGSIATDHPLPPLPRPTCHSATEVSDSHRPVYLQRQLAGRHGKMPYKFWADKPRNKEPPSSTSSKTKNHRHPSEKLQGSRATPATWLRTTPLGPTHEQPTGTSRPKPARRTQPNEGVAARRGKRMPHHLPKRTPFLFGSRKPSTSGIRKGPTRKQAIHHHPVPRKPTYECHLFRILLLRRLRLPIHLTTSHCRCRRALNPYGDHRAACTQSGILRSTAVGTSYSQNVPGGRSPNHS